VSEATRSTARRSVTDPDAVNALVRGFEVLDCVAAAGRALGNAEIAQQTGIPRPTVSRLLATLVGLGHLREARDGSGYELAAGVVRLAQAFLGAIDVRAQARPHLVALAEACSASAFLAVRDADDMLVVEAGRSRSAVALLGSDVGTRMAIASSALGRAWLAGVDETTRLAVIARLRSGTQAARSEAGASLDTALAAARRQGFALSIGEWHPNINSASVALRTPAGEVLAINCGGPSFLMPAQRLQDVVVPRLLATAAAIAQEIGGQLVPAVAPAGPTVRRRTAKSKPVPSEQQETSR
jgi:IclR family transcriptional regulator, positive regulator for flagellar biogenesis